MEIYDSVLGAHARGQRRGVFSRSLLGIMWVHRDKPVGIATAPTSYLEPEHRDASLAFKWLHKAAKQGVAEAEILVGLAYRSDQGVSQDPAEAARWFRMAAEKNWRPRETTSSDSRSIAARTRQSPNNQAKRNRQITREPRQQPAQHRSRTAFESSGLLGKPAGITTCASGSPPNSAVALAARFKLAGKEFVGEQRELYLSEERVRRSAVRAAVGLCHDRLWSAVYA